MPKTIEDSLSEEFSKLNHCGSLNVIEDWWLLKFKDYQDNLIKQIEGMIGL